MILTLTCSYCARQFERPAHKVYASVDSRYFCNDICRKLGIKKQEKKDKSSELKKTQFPEINRGMIGKIQCDDCGAWFSGSKKYCVCGWENPDYAPPSSYFNGRKNGEEVDDGKILY